MSDPVTPNPADVAAAAGGGQEPQKPVETFSREYVEDLRAEAAKYRTEKKDAVDAAKTEARAEAVQEYETQVAERDSKIGELETTLSDRTLELTKLKAVLSAEIPSEDVLEVAELVQGTDEESISESVKRVKALLSKGSPKSPAFDPTQGSGNNHIPLNGDPVLKALNNALGLK